MSKKILVIDDNEGVRKSFVLALEDTNYKVDTAETGESGLEKQSNGTYDLVYLDLKMPGMNGVEVLKGIRKNDKNLPVYIITAFHKEFLDDLNSAADDGCHYELLKKPLDINQIISVTNGIFGVGN